MAHSRDLVELAGFGMLVMAAWELHQVAGIVGAGVVALLYSNRGG